MIHLYLVRHGIAGARDDVKYPDDERRPLTQEGMRQFRRAALGIAALVGEADCLLTSPLLRAIQTATILHEIGGLPQPQQAAALAPGVPSDQVLAALVAQEASSIVIVGHEPGLSHLLATSTTGQEDGLQLQFKKGAAACVSFETTPCAGWGQLEWLLQPKMLRKLGA